VSRKKADFDRVRVCVCNSVIVFTRETPPPSSWRTQKTFRMSWLRQICKDFIYKGWYMKGGASRLLCLKICFVVLCIHSLCSTTKAIYRKYSGSFITTMKPLFVSDQTYYLHLYYSQITWRALTRYTSTILCIVIIHHIGLSHGYFFYARLIFPVHESSLTWLPCLPSSCICIHTQLCIYRSLYIFIYTYVYTCIHVYIYINILPPHS